MRLRYRAVALDDLHAIYTWRARQSPELAERVEAAILSAIDWLGAHPELGVRTDEPDVRRWPMTDLRYTIFYLLDPHTDTLDILRIRDGRQVQDVMRVPRSRSEAARALP